MAKLKNPVIGLGAKGTLGDAITFQRSRGTDIVRAKPTPAYRKTLPQQYQRWLYEDYAYLWTQQNEATRRQYAATGSRHHLTGFQYWMKYNLKVMPDIVGWWRLDELGGAIAYDSTPNPHNGVIVGASPAAGIIDHSRLFDGINDYITVNPPPPVSLTACTILCFLNTPPEDGINRFPFYWGYLVAPHGIQLLFVDGLQRIYGNLRNTAGVTTAGWVPWVANTFELHGIVWNGTTLWQVYNENLLAPLPCTGICAPTAPIYLGRRQAPPPVQWHDGYEDNLIIYNRDLDATEIARWSERRYP